MTIMYRFLKQFTIIISFILSFNCYSQSISISNSTGEPFNYNIDFQNLDQSRTLVITDILPSGLCYAASDIVADPSFIDFSGNTVSNPNGISGLIDASSLPTVVFNIPNNIKSGSFTITVAFCAGITADGFTVTNNICADYGAGNANDENFCSTTGLTSIASAINPWGNVNKEPLFPSVLGADGNYYIPTTGGASNYKITIAKDPLYAGSIYGMFNLTNASISELFLPCANVSLLSGPGTLDPSTNTISLNNDLNGNVPYEAVEFIVSVDYSNCSTFTDGQTVSNTVELNGTPVGGNPLTNIDSDTADVIAVDILPPPNLNGTISKIVDVTNPVPGCLGNYTITYINSDNRPVSMLDISDVLPNDILPQAIIVNGVINSASTTNTFDLSINNGTPTVFSLPTGHYSSSWNTNNNSFNVLANSNTLLYPGDFIQISVSFLINPGLSLGTTITNCTDFSGVIIDVPNNINQQLDSSSCASFSIENPEVKLCAVKTVRKSNTSDPFVANITNIVPTDELEFQICIQNNGSLDFNGQLVDVLDPKYELISIDSSGLPSGVSLTQNGQALTWSNLNLIQNCASFSNDYGCLNPSNQSYCVIVKVRVLPYTLPGNIDNNATLSDAGNNTITTEYAKVNVIESSVIKIEKEVSLNLTDYTQSLTINPVCETDVYYRITVTNLGNKPVSQFQIIDELPQVNDVFYPTTLGRDSDFSVSNIVDYSSPNYTVSYLNTHPSTTTLPADFDCSLNTGSTTSSNNTTAIVYDNATPLAEGDIDEIIIGASLVNIGSLSTGWKAVNSVYLGDCGINNDIITPSNMVELIIDSPLDTCTPLNYEPFISAVPSLFPLAVEQELNSDGFNGKDKEFGDIDNDGDIDILYTKSGTSSNVIHVLLNNAGPNNPPNYTLPGVSLNIKWSYSYRLVDWDNDGFNDIVALGTNPAGTVNGVFLYLNSGNGTFPASPSLNLLLDGIDFPFYVGQALAIGDLNSDGYLDILISIDSNGGIAYFENNGNNTFSLPLPQVYTPSGSSISNAFIIGDNGSFPVPEIFDADCQNGPDILISDPLLPSPTYGGGRVYFHENNGGTTTGVLPNINPIGVVNQFGLNDDPNSTSYSSLLACDWVVTRIVDYFGNGCPIAISFNPCNDKFFYYLQEDCLCPDSNLLSVEDIEIEFNHSRLVLFPNPSSSTIQLTGDNIKEIDYVIYDIHGREIKKGEYALGNSIDISGYQNGIYLVKVKKDRETKTLKFIKK